MEDMEGMPVEGEEKKKGAIMIIQKSMGMEGEEGEPSGVSCPKCGCKLKIEAED